MTALTIALWLSLFWQFKPAPPQIPQSQEPRIIEVPLLDCAGLPCVDLTSGSGKTVRLLVDLGEANAYLETKAAQALGVELRALKGSDGGDISQVQQTIVPGARLGDLPLGDFPFMVLDTAQQPDQSGQKSEPLPGDGALSYGAFKNRLVEIDLRSHVLRVSEPQAEAGRCRQECSDLVIQHVGQWGPVTLTTDGFSVNGQAVDVQLDTLFTGTMLIYPGSVEKLGLKKQSKAKPKELFPYIQSGVKLARADEGTVSFRSVALLQDGPLYFGSKDANLPAVRFDATAGMGLLSRATATFDFKGMHFWMESAAPQ